MEGDEDVVVEDITEEQLRQEKVEEEGESQKEVVPDGRKDQIRENLCVRKRREAKVHCRRTCQL